MRCGTTWMQQVVHQIVTRGRASSLTTDTHLYAISPWIDAVNSVSMESAPLVGQPPVRIIKTQLAGGLCPYGAGQVHLRRAAPGQLFCQHRRLQPVDARAVPAAGGDDGGLVLQRSDVLASVATTRRRLVAVGAEHDNVLFVHFEEMTSDFDVVLDQVAAFLGCAYGEERRPSSNTAVSSS